MYRVDGYALELSEDEEVLSRQIVTSCIGIVIHTSVRSLRNYSIFIWIYLLMRTYQKGIHDMH